MAGIAAGMDWGGCSLGGIAVGEEFAGSLARMIPGFGALLG